MFLGIGPCPSNIWLRVLYARPVYHAVLYVVRILRLQCERSCPSNIWLLRRDFVLVENAQCNQNRGNWLHWCPELREKKYMSKASRAAVLNLFLYYYFFLWFEILNFPNHTSFLSPTPQPFSGQS
uniref:Uncharacterized protein n=1 Tax=Cacopsylla melanoneura TaxID=428564 RepID=A0A8D8UXN6_9HEMI